MVWSQSGLEKKKSPCGCQRAACRKKVESMKLSVESKMKNLLLDSQLKTLNSQLRFSSDPQRSALQTVLDSGDQSAVEPPGPIPNPEVKRCSADGSGTIGPVRVGRRQV